MATLDEAKILIKETPISSIVGGFIPLSKKGANYHAICPFHADTKPSLTVNDSKGLFKCWACDTGGDAIRFVMLYKNQGYVEAVKEIAGRVGITIDEERKKKEDPKFEMARRVLDSSCKLFKKYAAEARPKEFLDFVKNRNLNETSINEFGLGFAPKDNALTKYLSNLPSDQRDKALKSAEELGLVRVSDRGQYDFFRDRVMFPIWDHYGKVRGYTARAVRADQVPKYMNSIESSLFKKGEMLYGFHLAKNEIRNQNSAILVEGNMDVIILHQFGIKNAVGTMGTAVTDRVLEQLLHLTQNIFLGMDTDPAGLAAMIKTNAALMQRGVLARYLNFAPAKDPDEFLQQFGRLELQKRIEDAPTFLDFHIQSMIPESIPTADHAKLELLNKIFQAIAPLGKVLIAKEKAINAAMHLGFSATKEDIVDAYLTSLNSDAAGPTIQAVQNLVATGKSEPVQKVQLEKTKILTKVTRRILQTLVLYPETLNTPQSADILDLMDHSEVKQFIQWLKGIYLEIDDSEYVNLVGNALSSENYTQEFCDVVTDALFKFTAERLDKKVAERMIGDLVLKLKEEQLLQKRSELKSKQKETLNQDESYAILEQIQQVQLELLKLKRT